MTLNYDEFNKKFTFFDLDHIVFVASQLKMMKKFNNLDDTTAVNMLNEWMENKNELCKHYNSYILCIFNILFKAKQMCSNDKSLFFCEDAMEYYKPSYIVDKTSDNNFQHYRIVDYVLYKYMTGEMIVNEIQVKNIGTGIFYNFMNDALKNNKLIEFGDDNYDYVHDKTTEFLNEKSYNECSSFYEKYIENDVVVYRIGEYERTIDYDEFHQRTSEMVDKSSFFKTINHKKRQRST